VETAAVNTIIFDLGNVLLDFDHNIAAEKIRRSSDKSMDEIYRLIFDSGVTGDFEEGKMSAEEFFSRIKNMLNLDLDYEAFVPMWNEIFFLSDKNRQVQGLARELWSGYKTAILSNINILHLEYIKSKYPFFSFFHEVLASCELKLRKPEPSIYAKALQVLGAIPETAFYTDDRPELVTEAKKLGIRGFVFCGVEQLKADLKSCGVDIGQSAHVK